jgi:hypothetical protein
VQYSGKFDPYFNYLPFEKAVIESNGKTPYDNKEVEKIVKQKSTESPAISPVTRRGMSTGRVGSKPNQFTITTKPTNPQ